MSLDPSSLTAALVAGGTIVADATVKEITKDAYQALKSKVRELFGKRAADAAGKLEAAATRDEGKTELARAIPDLRPDEADEIEPILRTFVEAIERDTAAQEGLAHARIVLDLDVGGNVSIDDVRGAREIGIRSRSDGDFTLRNVGMDPGGRSGN